MRQVLEACFHAERNDSIDQLFHGILALQDVEECYRFFGDLNQRSYRVLIRVQEDNAVGLQIGNILKQGLSQLEKILAGGEPESLPGS